MKKEDFPEWVLAHKKPGLEIKVIGGRYYLYEMKGVYDRERHRPKKKSGEYLGKITEADGFVPKRTVRAPVPPARPGRFTASKEWGVTAAIFTLMKGHVSLMAEHFPSSWQTLVGIVYSRLVFQSPLCNMAAYFRRSMLSELLPAADLDAGNVSRVLNALGSDRVQTVGFLKEFRNAGDNVIFDGTDFLSASGKMHANKLQKTKRGSFEYVLNMMTVFSLETRMPIYFRILPGDVKDMTGFRATIREGGFTDVTAIIDKGFASNANANAMEEEGMDYIMAIRRDDVSIDYSRVGLPGMGGMDGHFMYHGRAIWYFEASWKKGRRMVVFFDEECAMEEKRDFMARVEKNGTAPPSKRSKRYTEDSYKASYQKFGTLALVTSHAKEKKDARSVYFGYKSRGNVEQVIDVFKNVLDADTSYMQNKQTYDGWMLANFIAAQWYYILTSAIDKTAGKKVDLAKRHSVEGILLDLQMVTKGMVDGEWQLEEITEKRNEDFWALGVDMASEVDIP